MDCVCDWNIWNGDFVLSWLIGILRSSQVVSGFYVNFRYFGEYCYVAFGITSLSSDLCCVIQANAS